MRNGRRIELKNWQERYSAGVQNILQIIKVRKEKLEDAVGTMEDSSEPNLSLVKKINLCMINMLKKLEASMEQKIMDFGSFF